MYLENLLLEEKNENCLNLMEDMRGPVVFFLWG